MSFHNQKASITVIEIIDKIKRFYTRLQQLFSFVLRKCFIQEKNHTCICRRQVIRKKMDFFLVPNGYVST